MDKYFLFRIQEVTEYTDVFTNDGRNFAVLSISADRVSYVSARQGAAVLVFNEAGMYDDFVGAAREALAKTRVEVSCALGGEYELIKKITQFITNPNPKRRVMEFDVVTGSSTFNETVDSTGITALLPKLPVIMSTQEISDDPADTDLTQTTTTVVGSITFPSPSTMPIVDYNEDSLTSTVGQPVGSSHTWENAGTGGATYDIDDDTGTPTHVRSGPNSSQSGLATDGVSISAGEELHLANTLTVRGDYTMYFVLSRLNYTALGTIIDFGAVHIGFKGDGVDAKLNNTFYVRHNTGAGFEPAEMRRDNTDFNTKSADVPDPKLAASYSLTGGDADVPQLCYPFVLRRDSEYNMYLHDYTGDVIGYIPTNPVGQEDRSTNRDLHFSRIMTGHKGPVARFGVIDSDIGGPEAARIARDLFEHYRLVF